MGPGCGSRPCWTSALCGCMARLGRKCRNKQTARIPMGRDCLLPWLSRVQGIQGCGRAGSSVSVVCVVVVSVVVVSVVPVVLCWCMWWLVCGVAKSVSAAKGL